MKEANVGMDPRIGLAAERTLLAWVRTGLAMMGFGFVVARFGVFLRDVAAVQDVPFRPATGPSQWIGGVMVVLGVVVHVIAAVQHIHLLGRLRQGEPYYPAACSLGVIVTLVLAGIGVALAAYLIVSPT